MNLEALTVRILRILVDGPHTSAALAEKLGEPVDRVRKSIRNMRQCQFTVTTEGKVHSINDAGREQLVNPVRHKPMGTDKVRAQTAYSMAKPSTLSVSHENSVMRRPTWTPPAWTPARPGADDHKQFVSKGIV